MIAHQAIETIEVLADVPSVRLRHKSASAGPNPNTVYALSNTVSRRSSVPLSNLNAPRSDVRRATQPPENLASRIPVWILPGGPNDFDRKHRPATRLLSLVRASTIFIQRSYCQAALLAKRLPASIHGLQIRQPAPRLRPDCAALRTTPASLIHQVPNEAVQQGALLSRILIMSMSARPM